MACQQFFTKDGCFHENCSQLHCDEQRSRKEELAKITNNKKGNVLKIFNPVTHVWSMIKQNARAVGISQKMLCHYYYTRGECLRPQCPKVHRTDFIPSPQEAAFSRANTSKQSASWAEVKQNAASMGVPAKSLCSFFYIKGDCRRKNCRKVHRDDLRKLTQEELDGNAFFTQNSVLQPQLALDVEKPVQRKICDVEQSLEEGRALLARGRVILGEVKKSETFKEDERSFESKEDMRKCRFSEKKSLDEEKFYKKGPSIGKRRRSPSPERGNKKPKIREEEGNCSRRGEEVKFGIKSEQVKIKKMNDNEIALEGRVNLSHDVILGVLELVCPGSGDLVKRSMEGKEKILLLNRMGEEVRGSCEQFLGALRK